MITRTELLKQLPKYVGNSIVITDDQTVHDIVFEILDAHKEFAPYYDKIALYFLQDSTDDIADQLAEFCNRELHYKEETEDDQTTMLPSGILTRGADKNKGIDCKHYSSFCGGILDALNRAGKKIDWCYRFASYKLMNKAPHHVFVVVNPGKNEIWIDPTPNSNNADPYWYTDKKIKAGNMALRRVITGHDERVSFEDYGRIGANAVRVVVNQDPINYDGTGKYSGVMNPWLGLDWYADLNGENNLNAPALAEEINQRIQTGPAPGHTVSSDFVKWIYNSNVRSWNFFYPGGVKPGFNPGNLLPASWPRLLITEDGRLNLDRDVQLDDYRNAEIHLLTAWAQDLINQYDPTPYPVKPRHLKEFSQGKEGGYNTRNLFTEARGDSIFKEVIEKIGDVLEVVKEGVFKIVGSIPRNAFLGLVGLNAFNFAGNLQGHIDAGEWDRIANKWKSFGGNPDKLYNTIQDGKNKKAILGDRENSIGEPVTVSTLLAAAAPIIALLLQFVEDKDGKIQSALKGVKTFLASKGVDVTPLGFLDARTGQIMDIQIDPADDENLGGGNDDLPGNSMETDILTMLRRNPVPTAGIAAAAAYFILNKPGRKKNIVLPIAIGAGVFFLLRSLSRQQRVNAIEFSDYEVIE